MIYFQVSNLDSHQVENQLQINRRSKKLKWNVGEFLVCVFSIESDQMKSISLDSDIPIDLTWAENDLSLYYVVIDSNVRNEQEWKDILQYRSNKSCLIRRIDLDNENEISYLRWDLLNVPFLIGELLYSWKEDQLVFSSISTMIHLKTKSSIKK